MKMKKSLKATILTLILAALMLTAYGCKITPLKKDAATAPAGGETDPPTQRPIVVPTENPNYTDVAMIVGGVEITVAEYNYYYRSILDNFLSNTYGMGADMTQNLKGQISMWLGEDITVDEYLHGETVNQIKIIVSLCAEAARAGIELDEADKSVTLQTMNSIEASAAQQGLSTNDLIASHYGYGCDMDVLIANYERSQLASKYYMHFIDTLTFDDADIEAAYAADADHYDLADFRIFLFDGTVQDPDEDATAEEKTAAAELAMEDAKQRAEAMLAMIGSEADFIEQSNSNNTAAGFDGDVHTLMTGVKPDDLYDAPAVKNYLYEAGRKAGDVSVVKETGVYYVVMFLDRYRDTELYSVAVRHILVNYLTETQDEYGRLQPSEQEVAATLARAQAIYDEWLNGGKTEAAFAKLATENTDDTGSAATGGLYPEVTRNWAVEEFDEWCFDPDRAVGDSGIVETLFGFHIMYMSSLGEPYWVGAIKEEMTYDAADAHIIKLSGDIAFEEIENFDRSFIDNLVEPE